MKEENEEKGIEKAEEIQKDDALKAERRGLKKLQQLQKSLSHPLLLLFTGALISNFLVPSFTKQWQTREKEFEVKTDIVVQISKSVADITMTVQFAEVGAQSQTQEAYDVDYREWELEQAILESQLKAYFPKTQIGSEWNAYAVIVTEVYALSGTYDSTFRQERLERIREYFPEENINWQILTQIDYRRAESTERQQYMVAWFTLKEALLEKKDEIVQEILNSEITPIR